MERLMVPIYDPIPKTGYPSSYLIGHNISFEQFREILLQAEIKIQD